MLKRFIGDRLQLLGFIILGFIFSTAIFNCTTVFAAQKTTDVKYIDTIYDSITPICFEGKTSSTYFSVSRNDKYGIINLEGELVLPIEYENPIDNQYQLDNKYGMFFEDGTFIEPISEQPLIFLYGYSSLCIDGKYGVINSQGTTVIKPKYLDSFIYADNRFAVKQPDPDGNELWAIIDSNEKMYITPFYTRLSRDGIGTDFNGIPHILDENLNFTCIFYQDAFRMSVNAVAVQSDTDKWGITDAKGKEIVEPRYDSIELFDRESFDGIYKIVVKNKFGFMNQDGKILVEPVFYEPSANEYIPDYMTGFSLYMADVKVGSSYKKGLINNKGKLLLKPEYDDIIANWYNFEKSSYLAGLKKNVWKIYTAEGKFLINVEKGYTVEVIKYNTVYVAKGNKRYILDVKTGKHINTTEFSEYANPEISLLTESGKYFLISKDNKLGMVNNDTGKIILKPQFYYIGAILTNASNELADMSDATDKDIIIIATDKKGNCSLYSPKGKLLLKSEYRNIYDFVDGYAAVSTSDKIGIINNQYKLVVDTKYDSASRYSDGLFPVKLKGKWGYVDTNGNVIVKPVYDAATSFTNGLARVVSNGKIGFINKTGKLVIKTAYDDTVAIFTNGLSPVVKNGELYVIDTEGNDILETNVRAEENTVIYENADIDGYSNKVSVYLTRKGDKYGLCIIK